MTSSETSQVGGTISSNKSLTNRLLRERGLPVPESIAVNSVGQCLAAAERIGYPVVVKPLDGRQGRGIGVELRTPEKVREFFPIAMSFSRSERVVVESFIPGKEHRILVINDRVAAVAERMPAHVTGDGTHTVRELIEETNADPLRGPGHVNVLTLIAIDTATVDALERQYLTLDSVPEAGRHVKVKLVSNMSQGGSSFDRTDEIHPENARLARLAAQTAGIDICGVDLITPDITQPVWTAGGAFLELNFSPGFNMHLFPNFGQPRDLGEAVVDMLFPPGRPFRVPIVAVTGSQGVEPTCQMIARIMKAAGRTVGLSTSEGTSIDGQPMLRPDVTGRPHHRMVLGNPYVDYAVLEVQYPDVEQSGLVFDDCDVTVVTRARGDTPAGLRPVETVLLQTAGAGGSSVLDADDPLIVDLMLEASPNTILFGLDAANPTIRAHLAEGGRAVVAIDSPAGRTIALFAKDERTAIIPVEQIAVQDVVNPEDVIPCALAATAAAIAQDVLVDTIRSALRNSPNL